MTSISTVSRSMLTMVVCPLNFSGPSFPANFPLIALGHPVAASIEAHGSAGQDLAAADIERGAIGETPSHFPSSNAIMCFFSHSRAGSLDIAARLHCHQSFTQFVSPMCAGTSHPLGSRNRPHTVSEVEDARYSRVPRFEIFQYLGEQGFPAPSASRPAATKRVQHRVR